MLIRILQEIANSENHSYSSLAQTLNLDQEMVRQMFYNLQNMGYIISDDSDCADNACDSCGVCCTKRKKENHGEKSGTAITRWKLTEKGEQAIH